MKSTLPLIRISSKCLFKKKKFYSYILIQTKLSTLLEILERQTKRHNAHKLLHIQLSPFPLSRLSRLHTGQPSAEHDQVPNMMISSIVEVENSKPDTNYSSSFNIEKKLFFLLTHNFSWEENTCICLPNLQIPINPLPLHVIMKQCKNVHMD